MYGKMKQRLGQVGLSHYPRPPQLAQCLKNSNFGKIEELRPKKNVLYYHHGNYITNSLLIMKNTWNLSFLSTFLKSGSWSFYVHSFSGTQQLKILTIMH